MPYTTRLSCTEEDITKALLAHGEKIGNIGIDIKSQLVTLKTKANQVVSEYTDPLKKQLARVLAPTGKSVEAMIEELDLINGTTKPEIEASIKSRFGLSIVNGRLLVKGKTSTIALRELYRLLGNSVSAVEALLPEITTFNSANRFSAPDIQSRFFVIFTSEARVETEGDKCTASTISNTETVLGIDIPINSLTLANNIGREQLIANVFWVKEAAATASNRRKASKLRFTDDEFVSMVTTEGVTDYDGYTMNIKVYVLDDPFLITKIQDKNGDDAGDVISRGPDKINLAPSTDEIYEEAQKAVTKRAGAKTGKGANDYASGATSVMQVIDIEKTFDPDGTISTYSTETATEDPCFIDIAGLAGDLQDLLSDAHDFMGDILSAMNSPQKMLNELIAGLSDAASGALNELTSVLGVVNNTLNDPDFLQCFFGAGFSLDLEFGDVLGPLNDLLDLIEDGASIALDFLDLIGDALSAISQLACLQAALTGGLTGALGPAANALAALGVNCVLNGPDLPKCIQEVIDAAALAADFMWNLLAAALTAIRVLHLSLKNLSLSIRGNIATNAGTVCNPAETALLTALLVEKTLAMEELLSL